ncbi:permease [Bosea sp. AAP35]|uniref:efflux RND transporter periplasmic adaptor subunit n=1 Tax=Bosea sp. AAP35 TaxID=1523417 RepID=UPI0006B8ADA2|nr:efflux RND transporter periplasmic adaptor subunit [Bosea sp. AAP35]KPF71356.1 permease [Bosea sp. AAP35]
MKVSRRIALFVGGAIAVAAIAGYVGMPLIVGSTVPVDAVVRTDFVRSIVASGHVEAPFRISIGAQITGTVTQIPVIEGQTVKAGDTLIMLDDREAKAAVVQAEGVRDQAVARIRQLRELTLPSARETLTQAKATLVNAQQIHARALKLVEDGYGARTTLDDAIRGLDIARAQVRNADLQVFTNSPGGSDVVMQQTQLDQANAALGSARSRLAYTVITTPTDGILISRNVETGNVVGPSTVLMTLSPIGASQIVLQIDEKNIGLVALGQPAIASADAYPRQTFRAEVSFINPAIDIQRASVEVKLNMPDAPAYLRQDMTISVDIEVGRRDATLVVPMAALREFATGKPWLLVAVDGRARRQAVTVGLMGAGRAEILSGVDEGALIVPATAAIAEGARIRPKLNPKSTP